MIDRFITIAALALLSLSLGSCSESETPDTTGSNIAESADAAADERPNVLVIVVDDVGFNDLSLFGSEINTPNIDGLAGEGIFLTNFHASPNCSPTRAMLLSGTDNHIAGLGTMFEELIPIQKGKPGYEGHLNFRVAAMSEVLQDAGYNTYMTGKWHLGLEEETSPAARGFDKSFAMLEGGAGAFDNMLPIFGDRKAFYREDGKSVERLPEGFYSTRFYTERMMEYIESGRDDGKPFFAYLAHTSPHWPLQAPQESIAKYDGVYDAGYDALLEQRLNNLKERGLVDGDVEPFARFKNHRPWNELSDEERRYEAKLMQIYAAMIDDVDVYTGRLIAYLKEIGEYDNTIIFFMSDNGPEAHDFNFAFPEVAKFAQACCDNSYENIGNADSYVWYGPKWGQAGNTPLRMFKGYVSEGGLRVPAFIHFPKRLQSGEMNDAITTVKDVMPTLLEIAGVEHPGAGTFRGRQVVAMQGRSMLPLLTGEQQYVYGPDEYLGWELFGKRTIRKGDWKILYVPGHASRDDRLPILKPDQWQLYNLAEDPTETNDLAESQPDKLAELLALWEEYAAENNIVLPDKLSGY